MLKTIIALIASFTAAAQMAHAQPKWTQGQTYSGNIDIGGVQVPLPAGDWLVTGVEYVVTANAGNGGQSNIGLAQSRDGKLQGYISLSYNQQALSRGWTVPAAKNCTRTEIHHAAVIRDAQVDKSCTYVNHVVFTISATSAKWWKDTVDYAKQNGIAVPLAVIQGGVVVSDRANFIAVAYHFNPESKGFSPPKNTAWQTSDWSALNVAGDEQKRNFVKSVIDWTEVARPALEAGLAGKLKKGAGLDWPVAMQ